MWGVICCDLVLLTGCWFRMFLRFDGFDFEFLTVSG